MHWQAAALVLPEPTVLLCGLQDTHTELPVTLLYVPTGHALHAVWLPLNPGTHTHWFGDVLAVCSVVLCAGHKVHAPSPGEDLYRPAGQAVHVVPVPL
jgi:hypothetical protein